MKEKSNRNDLIRLIAIFIVSVFVLATGVYYASSALYRGDLPGAVLGCAIALIVLAFAILTYVRGNKDLREGFPLQDERSRRVTEMAASKAFYVSLYLLLFIGLLSEGTIEFRDVSQATGVAVGGMALLWAIFWVYYNSKEI